MAFQLNWLPEAAAQYQAIMQAAGDIAPRDGKKQPKPVGLAKQVNKTLALLQRDPKHPGLNTHLYHGYENPYETGRHVWEAYVQNQTPGAYRVFWCYGPGKGVISIIAITRHP